MKLSLCLCFFSVAPSVVFGFGSSESDQSQNTNQNPNQDSKCFFSCEDFKALKTRNREQGKVIEDLKEQFKSLSQKFDQLEIKISEDDGLSMLRPPLRGPPGKDGKQGEKGETGQPGPKGEPGFSAPQSISSCSAAMETFPPPRSKKQTIYPHGNNRRVEVLCDFETDGGGWTIIQKRTSGPKYEFHKNWNEYKKGFGSLNGNFWLGLENIHALTQNGDQELRIEMEDFEGEKRWAKYSSFSVSDASDFYKLAISGFFSNSTAGDSMTNPSVASVTNGMRFSTTDKDNDEKENGSCVNLRGYGGWWFNECGGSALNALYFDKGETVLWAQGVRWDSWKGNEYSLAKSEMKIRTKKSM